MNTRLGQLLFSLLLLVPAFLYLANQSPLPAKLESLELTGSAGRMLALTKTVSTISSGLPSTRPLSAEEVFRLSQPFTVEVWIRLEDGSHAPATGIIVGAGNYVLTNAHVVAGNPTPTIRVRDEAGNEKDYPSKVVAVRRDKDLGLIAIEGVTALPVATFADSSQEVSSGDLVYTLGSPLGSHWKIQAGTVIGVRSPCGLIELHCIRLAEGAMHPGNSGGPLLDNEGYVIGVNRALQQSTGEGVSIPVEEVQDFLSTYLPS